jgi:hypothetical protein
MILTGNAFFISLNSEMYRQNRPSSTVHFKALGHESVPITGQGMEIMVLYGHEM